MTNTGDFYLQVIERLNLKDYYPQKITREEVLVVSDNVISSEDLKDRSNIPWYILQNLIMCNYEGRCFDLEEYQPHHVMKHSMSSFLEEWPEEGDATKDSDQVSPSDALVAIFLCCDDFVRQILMEKLSICQLAIPLILPIFHRHGHQWEFLLWATRTIRKKWKSSSGSSCEKLMVYHKLPIVSAIRIGRPQVSKSNILNCLINEQKHSIFIHSGCKGGHLERKLFNGLLEMAWYLPTQSQNTFPDALTFVNLRGNASDFKPQTEFLSEVSMATIAFVSSSSFDEDDDELLESLYKQKGHLILVIDGPGKYLKKSLLSMEQKFAKRTKSIGCINCSNKNEFKLSGELWQFLTYDLPHSDQPGSGNVLCNRSIEMCTEIAQKMDFYIDEFLPHCIKAKQCGSEIVKILHESGKEDELPLQKTSLKIGDKKKEQHRLLRKGNTDTQKYVDRVKAEIRELRRKQLQLHRSRPDICTYKMFSKAFISYELLERKYFFGFVKVMTDRYSIDKLQPIREHYICRWNTLCEEKKNEVKSSKSLLESMKTELDKLEHNLSIYSLGLEHFNREIGQNYEMSSELKLPSLNKSENRFALIAAEMLLYGYPIELMDGDASHVPLTWIEAVFNALKSQVGNKRMFVLSVLGIQSSGKSTMLNAMFGLQFAVSAGRCTKGIFAQLVPVDRSLQEDTKCDYILVIDTEGLRAPEFASIQPSKNHDNELATLVIGLGDLTMINIMGENPTDMQDTLQIAVHAFIKMDNVKIKPSCIFVHQNITDVTASDMNTTQKRSMRELLDKITTIAAEEENCSDRYQSFSDVINFEENKHILYVSSLWEGDPPMAPPNPGYSKCILQVRQEIIQFMKRSEPKSVDAFKRRLSDIWKAILYQNFVFSFKNSLEIKAYNALNTEFVKHSRTLRRNAAIYSDKLETECKKLTANSIENEGKCILENYLTKLDKDITTFISDIDNYFAEEVNACQWKGQTEIKMSEYCRGIRKDLIDQFASIRIKITGRAEIDENIKRYERNILRKAAELAYQNKDLSEESLTREFSKNWTRWISDIPQAEDYLDVQQTFERMIETSSLIPREEVSRVLQSDVSQIKVTEKDLDFGFAKSFFARLPKATSKKTYLDSANKILQNIRDDALKQISAYRRDGKKYTINLGVEIFAELSNKLEKLNAEGKIKLTIKGRIRLAVCNFWSSLVPSLKDMQDQYRQENDLHLYMESQRYGLWQMFRDECIGLQISVKATSVVCRVLENSIRDSLSGQCKLAIIDHLRSSTSQAFASKRSFHAYMLIDIAEQHDFKRFDEYLSNPIQCMKNFITKHIHTVCFRKKGWGVSLMKKIYCQKVRDQCNVVKKAIDRLPNMKTCTMKYWWPALLDGIGNELSLKRDIGFFNEDDNFNLIELKNMLITKLKDTEDKLIKEYRPGLVIFKEVIHRCGDFFQEDLIGCLHLCPFCKAICDLQTGNDYYGHRTEYHRPDGVAGYVWHDTNQLSTNLCTSSVISDDVFQNEDTNNEWRQYKDYQSVNEYYKSWKIEPIVGDSELYWKWFMATYNKELAKRYDCKEADIPDGWKEISWESAKEEMIMAYAL